MMFIILAVVLALTGCAMGRYIAGAPSTREQGTTNGLLARRCGGCHAIPHPEAMPAAEWRAALDRMHQRMRLPASEWDSLATLARAE